MPVLCMLLASSLSLAHAEVSALRRSVPAQGEPAPGAALPVQGPVVGTVPQTAAGAAAHAHAAGSSGTPPEQAAEASAGASRPAALFPTRDVALTYVARDAQDGAGTLHFAIDAAGRRLRIQPDGLQSWYLLDLRKHIGFLVVPAARVAVALPEARVRRYVFAPPADARYTRLGPAQVAGLACTRWQIADATGSGRVCLSEEGVLLSVETQTPQDGARGDTSAAELRATAVSFAPLPADAFSLPADYQIRTVESLRP